MACFPRNRSHIRGDARTRPALRTRSQFTWRTSGRDTSVAGNAIGASAHVGAAAFGLSALLATSTIAFSIAKFAGAAYLVYLGVQAIVQRHDGDIAVSDTNVSPRRLARSPLIQGAISELLNPKTALYFMALLPHFVHPEHASAPMVFLILGLIALALAMSVDVVVALAAGRLASRLMGNKRWRVRQRVASGLTMIGLGGFVAVAD